MTQSSLPDIVVQQCRYPDTKSLRSEPRATIASLPPVPPKHHRASVSLCRNIRPTPQITAPISRRVRRTQAIVACVMLGEGSLSSPVSVSLPAQLHTDLHNTRAHGDIAIYRAAFAVYELADFPVHTLQRAATSAVLTLSFVVRTVAWTWCGCRRNTSAGERHKGRREKTITRHKNTKKHQQLARRTWRGAAP